MEIRLHLGPIGAVATDRGRNDDTYRGLKGARILPLQKQRKSLREDGGRKAWTPSAPHGILRVNRTRGKGESPKRAVQRHGTGESRSLI